MKKASTLTRYLRWRLEHFREAERVFSDGAGKSVGRTLRAKEGFLEKALVAMGGCQVRSGTDCPCPRPAVTEVHGVPFCEVCAREQEAFFAIGELTEGSESSTNEPLGTLLHSIRHSTPRSAVKAGGPHAA